MLAAAVLSSPSHSQPLLVTNVAAASIISQASGCPAARSCDAVSNANSLSADGDANFSAIAREVA
jgi:hypothetical protein